MRGLGADDPPGTLDLVQAVLESAVLQRERLLLGRPSDRPLELHTLERLGDEVVGSLLHRLDRVLHGPVAGDNDHLDVGSDGPGRFQQFLAAELRHLEVHQHNVDLARPEPIQTGLAVIGQHHLVSEFLQRPGECLSDRLVVVHHQDTEPGLVGRSSRAPHLCRRKRQPEGGPVPEVTLADEGAAMLHNDLA